MAINRAKFERGMIVATTSEMIYQLTGSNMSSPQTAELNANARAPTIDKWVKITHWEAVAWTTFFWWLYGSPWAIVGGGRDHVRAKVKSTTNRGLQFQIVVT